MRLVRFQVFKGGHVFFNPDRVTGITAAKSTQEGVAVTLIMCGEESAYVFGTAEEVADKLTCTEAQCPTCGRTKE